jgi:DNA ligase 1
MATVRKIDIGGVLLAHSWDGESDPTGWIGSEKYDGVRGYYRDGDFVSRGGNVFFVPEWFKAGLPQGVDLDGELWMGRQQYERGCGIVKRHNEDAEWKLIKFHVFDAPTLPGGFEERIAALPELLKNAPYAEPVKHFVIESKEHLEKCVDEMVEKGGEGIMIRKPGSLYERKRSRTLLKCKKWFDCEALVVDINEGKGRNAGILGAVVCEIDGERFNVGGGFSDLQRRWFEGDKLSLETIKKFWVGKVIKVKYQNKTETRGVPRFGSFISIEDSLPETSGQDTPVAAEAVTKAPVKEVTKKMTSKKKASKKSKKASKETGNGGDATDYSIRAYLETLGKEVTEVSVVDGKATVVTKATKSQVTKAVLESFPKATLTDSDPKWSNATGRTWVFEVSA